MIRFPMQSKVKTVIPRTKESRVRTIYRPQAPTPPTVEQEPETHDIQLAEGESPDVSPLAVSVPSDQLTLPEEK